MELLDRNEIDSIVKQYGFSEVLHWSLENYSNKLIGYLGEHLRLIVQVRAGEKVTELKLFVKCMPRFDEWKANYLKELSFFKKEYVMLSQLFKEFRCEEGFRKWRPKLLFIKEELFVFEDVSELGYKMPHNTITMTYDEIIATVETVARFHAQSLIYEEKKSKQLNKPYTIWDEYSEYLQEPSKGMKWRNAGRNAVIDYLKVFSNHKAKSNFSERIEIVIPMLFDRAVDLMRPSSKYRNVVVHRDLWTNNIFLKKYEKRFHAQIVDFQTVLYSSPMMDLSSLIYFNTTKKFRKDNINRILDYYYETLTEELKMENIDVNSIFPKIDMIDLYRESIMFGITQAAIIVPIVVMTDSTREKLFSDPETCAKINEVSRSKEVIEIAKRDDAYRSRVTELFDEIVERYVYPNVNRKITEN